MPDYSIKLELPDVADVDRVIGDSFKLVAQAVRAIAQEARLNWIQAVNDAPIWSGEKTPYIDSIKVRYLSELRAEVVSDYRYAAEIETGRPGRDMKRVLNTSPKVRRDHAGKRFLVIPMRANTPGNTAHAQAMPTSVYELAREMRTSSVTGTGTRPAGQVTTVSPGAGMAPSPTQTPFLSNLQTKGTFLVAKQNYQWGDRLTGKMLAKESPAVRRRYAGMVRMTESSGGSSYLTFRTMVEGSNGWVRRPEPGLYLARDVAEHLQPIAEAAIAEAMRREANGENSA